MKSRISFMWLLLAALPILTLAQGRSPLTFDDLMAVKRVADPQISPDGQRVAYVVNVIDKGLNSGKRSIWVTSTAGGAVKQLITSAKNDDSPRWSADGSRIAFLSTRAGSPQIYVADAGGANPVQVTNAPLGVAEFIWSPDGKLFAFTTDVYPACQTLKCSEDREDAATKSKVKAKIADSLLFRHWNAFKEGKRSHLFVVASGGGDARDLTPGDYDVPPFSLGDPTAFDFAPDGKEICFARDTERVGAISTNNDLFLVSASGGEARRITGNNPGSDTTPRYSPDGRWIAYRSQARNGYESDRFRLMLYDRSSGISKDISKGFDHWVGELVWAADGKQMYLSAEDKGHETIYIASLDGVIKPIIAGATNAEVTVSKNGTLAFTRSSLNVPAEVFKAGADGQGVSQLSTMNSDLLARVDLKPAEEFKFAGAREPVTHTVKAGGLKASADVGRGRASTIHGYIIKPPNFDPAKKYPMVLLIHGGPQGAWLDSWGYRWNPQVFAARGYVTVMINPHGSTGYGQAFTEQISGDWGGAVYEDLMKGVDYMVQQGYVDANRLGAAGGSYGGYMVDWILGHTDRFKALVSHAGVYNLTSMYGATEELWFPEWEFKGTPWEHPELYQKWSPHLFAKNFKTPTLVVHGELDYRVPVGEGLQLFTTLQRKGVPSKLLYFPDEGHWVSKPQNSELWYKTVLDWFDQWLKPNGSQALK